MSAGVEDTEEVIVRQACCTVDVPKSENTVLLL